MKIIYDGIEDKAKFGAWFLDRTAGGAGVPVLGTYYTVASGLSTINQISVFREDDDAVAKEISVRIYESGTLLLTATGSQNDATQYWWWIFPYVDAQVLSMQVTSTQITANFTTPIRGRSLRVDVASITTALGANPELKAMVVGCG